MDQSSASQNRKSRRSNVLLTATLETPGGSVAVKLRNLSAEGALVQGERLPPAGAEVVFQRNELSAAGRIAWVHGHHAGIAFADALPPADVLRNVPAPKPKYEMAFRRPGFTSRLTEGEVRMVERWR